MSELLVGFEVGRGAQASKFVALHCIGLLISLRDGYVSLDEVGRFFLPRMVRGLKDRGIDRVVVDLVCLGCELEDVDSLIPDKLGENIDFLLKGFFDYLSGCSGCDFFDIKVFSLEPKKGTDLFST